MKILYKVLFISLISGFISLLALVIYDHYLVKETIIIQEARTSAMVKSEDFLLNGELQRHFLSSAPTNFIKAAKKSTPAVVYIKAENGDGFQNMRGFNNAAGSGVIISPDGYIATNNHVIEDGTNITVVLNDRREFAAEIIGTDPTTDLALLKIEASDLPFLVFGNSDSLQVGEWVLAVGNPFRLQSTVTAGIVSAKGRNINILDTEYGIESFIQTDAAVNPGNSGGALVNTNGELIGINTAIITYSGRYEGYSFAIPSNLAMKVIFDLKEFGAVHRGLLGITAENLTVERANQLGMASPNGVHVVRVTPESGAHKAGIRRGDVIVGIEGRPINTLPEMLEILGRFRPGDEVEINYVRRGETFSTRSMLKNQLNTTDLISVRKDRILTDLGFEVRDLLPSEERRMGRDGGVKVISIYRGSTIARTKMEPGYIITKMNEQPIANSDQLVKMLEETRGRIFFEGHYEKYPGPWWYAFHR